MTFSNNHFRCDSSANCRFCRQLPRALTFDVCQSCWAASDMFAKLHYNAS